MFLSKKIDSYTEKIEIDFQTLASELDTSLKDMRILSSDMMQDSVSSEEFEKLIYDIENESGEEAFSFDDNTVMYEYLDEAIIVYTNLGSKTILFDEILTKKIEAKMGSFRRT